MARPHSILDTIASVYAVPGDEAGWADVLEKTTGLVHGTAGIYLLIDDVESHTTQICSTFGYPRDEIIELYSGDGAARKDVRYQYLHNLVPGKAFREFEFVPDRAAYDACEWIQHELRTRGIYWNIAAQISTHGLWRDIVSFNRLQTAGAYSDEEKATLQALLPHMSRAAELHPTFMRLAQVYGAVLAVLDRLLVGMIILDARGRMVVANAAACQAAESSGALVLRPGAALRATDPASDGGLQKLIADASRTAQACGTSDGGQLVVPRRNPGPGLLLEVMPLRDDGLPDSENIRGAAVFVVDPQCAYVLNSGGLAKIFALSSAERAAV